ncbi:alpha/beta hydrolase [Actinoplanes sp. NPDC051851]|uniref:alpha/beta hydrolase n=1 Tax=Actinoplanes sp. NPDC051851 TaxID=3154753 RepID=UPI003435C48A
MDFLKPFVLTVPSCTVERQETIDLHLPGEIVRPRPAIVFVHGGPLPPFLTPRDWPRFQGYGGLAAARGAVGVVAGHGLHTPADYPTAAADVAAAIETVRSDPRVDEERVALWFFSGSGLLAADWLRQPPSWLRGVALSYPFVVPYPEWNVPERFVPVASGEVPVVLTRVGREEPRVAEGVAAFVAGAANLEIVDVPQGRHGFDVVDDDDASRAAIERAMDLIMATLA